MALQFHLKDDLSETVYYDFTEYPVLVRQAMLSSYPNYAAPSHWHDSVEFIVILSGSMDYNVNGSIIPLQKGDGIFVNAKQLHFGFSQQKECQFLFIILHPLLLCISHAMENDFVLPLIENPNAAFFKLDSCDRKQAEIIKKLKYIYEIKNSRTAPLKIQSAFAFIWSELFEIIPQAKKCPPLPTGNLTILKNMIGFIQQNYREKVSLKDIAASGAVGQSKCCKLFSSYLHQTPNEYLTAYRLNKGCELLYNTDRTVVEIALEVGFGGASYFAEIFRKVFGQSPTEYRQQNTCKKGKSGLAQN